MRRSLLPLVLAAACAPAALIPVDPPQPEPAFVQLEESEIAAIAALLRMEDRRELDAGLHAALAAHPNPIVRGRAALAAGRIGGADVAAALLPLLRDSVLEVRADAAFALGLLADSSATVIDALARLATRPIVDEDVIEAIHALSRAGAHDRLISLLEQPRGAQPAADTSAGGAPTRSPGEAMPDTGGIRAAEARRTAEIAFALWRLPRTDASVEHLVRLAASEHAPTRWAATYSLSRMAPPRAAPALRRLLEDDVALIRSHAARALRGPIADSAGVRVEARSALIASLTDADPHVRINSARALGSYAEPIVVAPLARLLADPDSNVVLAAVEALAAAGPDAAAELRRVATNHGARVAIRAAAIGGLVRHDLATAEPILAEWARAPDWLRRMLAARALAAVPWQTSGSMLVELARDADPRVAAAAYGAIAASAPEGAAFALQVEALASPVVAVRAAAVRGIARHAGPQHLAILMEVYEVAQHDAEVGAALAVVDALAALAAQGVPAQRTFYARFQPPGDPVLRRHVAQRLQPSPWRWRPVETEHSEQWYRTIVRTYIAAPLAGEPLPRAIVEGPTGAITLELDGVHAPLTVHNFITLAERGAFDSRPDSPPGVSRWHRVVPAFVLQDGDSFGDGSGGAGHSVRDELNRLRYGRGVLGMALSGPDTGSSQWFITHAPQPHLDAGYTVFGRVVSGMEAADRILQDDPIQSIRIERGRVLGGS
jgi:cyclophilin family peptidyl-prolyl cis-trans isomerase/HEAT repeat protein